jgi:hypothetical protein
MMFGLDWAPLPFHQVMEDIIAGHSFVPYCERMVDNFLQLGRKNDITGFLLCPIDFYQMCNEHIPLLPVSQSFCRETTEFYGRKLGYLGTIECNETSINKILSADEPYEGLSQVRHVLGMARWLANFSLKLAEALAPWYELLKLNFEAYNHSKYEQHWRDVRDHMIVKRLPDITLHSDHVPRCERQGSEHGDGATNERVYGFAEESRRHVLHHRHLRQVADQGAKEMDTALEGTVQWSTAVACCMRRSQRAPCTSSRATTTRWRR